MCAQGVRNNSLSGDNFALGGNDNFLSLGWLCRVVLDGHLSCGRVDSNGVVGARGALGFSLPIPVARTTSRGNRWASRPMTSETHRPLRCASLFYSRGIAAY